jgi:hypothetical protein
VIQPQRLLARASRLALAPDVQFLLDALDCWIAARLAPRGELGQVFIGHGEPPGIRRNGHLDAVAVVLIVNAQIGLQAEAGAGLLQQLRQPAGGEGERLDGISADRRAERVGEGAQRADAREGLHRVQQIALAGRVRAEEHRQAGELDARFDQGLEAADR